MGNDVPGPVGTEGARPTNRAKDISSLNPSSLPEFSGEEIFPGEFFVLGIWVCLGDFSCMWYGYVVWLCGMVVWRLDEDTELGCCCSQV